jgi:hypothetical protein
MMLMKLVRLFRLLVLKITKGDDLRL